MTASDELLAECARHPGDDEPRLVWGDAVGGERGELVAIQCAPRDELTAAELAVLNRRERELLARAMEHAQLAGLVHRVRFRRGFVDAIDVDADAWIELGDEIVRRAPLLTAITLREAGDADNLERALSAPAFARIRALDIVPPRDRAIDAVHAIVRAGVLPQLVALGVDVEIDSAFRLAQAGIAHLERLHLHGACGHAIAAIARAATGLTALSTVQVNEGSFETGFPRLVDLDLRANGDWLPLVAPLAPRLERLAVFGQGLLAHPRELARCTRLRVLELARSSYTGDALLTLVHYVPPTVRELRLVEGDRATATEFARRLAPQLDLLDLRASPRLDPAVAAACAGDVLVDDPIEYELLHAGPRRRGEWQAAAGHATDLPGAPAWLAFESGPEAGHIWDLTEHRAVRIGRSVDAGIRVPHESLARHHAEVSWRDGRHWLRDLRSTNGTLLDGRRVTGDTELADGARIEFGMLLARFFAGSGGGARATAAVRELDHIDPRTRLPRGRPDRVGAVLAMHVEWIGELAAPAIARRLVAAAGPGVTVTWLGRVGEHRHAFGITPGDRAAELAAACSGPATLPSGETVEVRLEVL